MISMDKLKNMSDAELIHHLRENGIPHGPIVDTTRTLYEKKLFEYERKKKSYPSSAESSYESKQQYSTREYDANQGSLINVGETALSVHHNQQDQIKLLQVVKELPCTSCSHTMGAKETKQKMGAKKALQNVGTKEIEAIEVGTSKTRQKMGAKDVRQKKDFIETKQKMGARVTRQKKTVVETKQKMGARETRQKMTIVETTQKGVRVTRQKKDVGETRQQLCAANPASDLSATATIVEETQEPEIKVASPTTYRCYKPALTGALSKKHPEEKPSYSLAMSLVPLLDKVPVEKMVDLRRNLLNVITACSLDAPPKLPQPNSIAPPPASAKH